MDSMPTPHPEAPRKPASSAFSLTVLAIDAALLVGLGLATIRLRGEFARIFDDFDAKLPQATQLILSVPWYLIAAGVAVALLLLTVKEVVLRDARVKLALNLAALLGLFALAAALVVTLFLPLIVTIESLK